jgi:hypothetical protein
VLHLFALFTLLTLAPKPPASPTVWSFDGPLAIEVQQYIQQRYAPHVKDHLFGAESVGQYLNRAFAQPAESLWSCLGDETECDLETALFKHAKIAKRVYVHARSEGGRYIIHLVLYAPNAPQPVHYREVGDSFEATCGPLLNQILEMGRLKLKQISTDTQVQIDGQTVGRGPGIYPLSAGAHTLRLSAPQHTPHTEELAIKAGHSLEISVHLVSALSHIKVKVLDQGALRDLKVTLNQKMIQAGALQSVGQGKHLIEVSAHDRVTYSKTIDIGPSEKITIPVSLSYTRAEWKMWLRDPHPDAISQRNQLYFRFKGGSAQAGLWPAEVSDFDTSPGMISPDSISTQNGSIQFTGFDLGINWNLPMTSPVGPMRFDLLAFSYERFNDSGIVYEDLKESMDRKEYDLVELSRYHTRFLWVGYQLPMWRVIPYLQTGLIWTYESGKIVEGDQSGAVSYSGFRLGWEAGIDVAISPEWVIKTSLSADTWPGERSVLRGTLGFAYSLSLIDDIFE